MKLFQSSLIFRHSPFTKAVFLYNLVALLSLFSAKNLYGQEDWPCETEDPVVFSGEGGATLCMQYGNLSFDYQIGVGSPQNVTTSQLFTQIYGAVPLGARILVVGDFIVNSPSWELEGAFVKVATGKKITTLGNVVLTLDNTKIFACTGFWKGITLSENGTIVTMSGTQIEDAENAIASSVSNTKLSITSTTFNRNKVGILLGRKNEFTLNPPLITQFDGNSFVCTSGLNGSLPGVPQVTEAGIISNNVPMSLLGDNLFEKIQYGIIMTGTVSSLTGSGFDFQKMYRDGIYAENANITLNASTFKNCARKGIFCKRVVYVDVINSDFLYDNGLDQKFSGLKFAYSSGIYVEGFALNSRFKIRDGNAFEANFSANKAITGIDVNCVTGDLASGFEININRNTFKFINTSGSITNAVAKGIYFRQGNFPENTSIEIAHNIFEVVSTVPGSGNVSMINFNGGQKHSVQIRYNRFEGTRSGGAFWNTGITFSDCNGFNRDITDNSFPPSPVIPQLSNVYLTGVDIGYSDNVILCSNKTIKNCNKAFFFSGAMDFIDLLENTVTGGMLIEIAANSWIDETKHEGNQQFPYYFNGSFNQAATQARCADFEDLSRFIVHQDQSTGYFPPNWRPYHPKDIIPDMSNEWWRKESGAPSNTCLTMFQPGLEDLLTPLKVQTASGTLASTVGNPVLVNFAEEGLYEFLRLNPQFAAASPLFQSFLSAKQNTNIQRFYEIGRAIEGARIASSNLNNSAESSYLIITGLHQMLFQLDSILANSNNLTELASATTDKLSAVNQMMAALQNIQTTDASFKTQAQSNIPSILLQLTAIVASSEVDQNIKTAFGHYAQSLTTHIFSKIERDAIFEIAAKCPQNGGSGVILARGLVDKCDFEALQNVTISCEPPITAEPIISEPAQRPSNERISEKMVQSSLVTDEIILNLPNEGSSEVSLFDGLGRVIYNHSSASGSLNIPVQNLAPAIYYLVIQQSSGGHETIKIVKVNR